MRLIYSPPVRLLLLLAYPDIYSAGDHVMEILAHRPIGLEGIDDRALGYIERKGLLAAERALLPPGGGWLIAEFGRADRQEVFDRTYQLMVSLKQKEESPAMRLFDDAREAKMIWRIRESALGALMRVPGEKDTWEGWEDAAVPPESLGHYLRDFQKLVKKYGYSGALYGHFGQGCVHNRLDFDFKNESGHQHFPHVSGRGRRLGRQLWRFTFGRAWG